MNCESFRRTVIMYVVDLIQDQRVKEILKDPYYFKPFRGDMHSARRAHIDKHFVLIF